jgi:hypothetical protein
MTVLSVLVGLRVRPRASAGCQALNDNRVVRQLYAGKASYPSKITDCRFRVPAHDACSFFVRAARFALLSAFSSR